MTISTNQTPTETNPTRRLMQQLIDEQGEWTAMNVYLGDGLYTRGSEGAGDLRLRRLLQVAMDLLPCPVNELRVLDLACLEGHYGLEFAMQGAKRVVGIEGREVNLAKAKFSQEALGLSNIEFFCDDVRNLSREKYGSFDVVICSGILYHLDAPDVFDFVNRIAETCDGIALFDTYVSIADVKSFSWQGKEYWGREYREHAPDASAKEKKKDLWASIENVRSIWLTRSSLFNLLTDVGFTSVLECFVPTTNTTSDRITLVAVKRGGAVSVRSSPPTSSLPHGRLLERQPLLVHVTQDWRVQLRGKLSRLLPLPRPVKELIKRVLRGAGLMAPDPTPAFLKPAAKKKETT